MAKQQLDKVLIGTVVVESTILCALLFHGLVSLYFESTPSTNGSMMYPKSINMPNEIPTWEMCKILDKRGDALPDGDSLSLCQIDYLNGHFTGWRAAVYAVAEGGFTSLSDGTHKFNLGQSRTDNPYFFDGWKIGFDDAKRVITMMQKTYGSEAVRKSAVDTGATLRSVAISPNLLLDEFIDDPELFENHGVTR